MQKRIYSRDAVLPATLYFCVMLGIHLVTLWIPAATYLQGWGYTIQAFVLIPSILVAFYHPARQRHTAGTPGISINPLVLLLGWFRSPGCLLFLLAFLYAFIWIALPLYLSFFVPSTSAGEYVIYRERFWSVLGIIVGWVWLQSLRELPRD